MTTAKEYLARYNEAATKLGRPTLKAWKGSTALIMSKYKILEDELAALQPAKKVAKKAIKKVTHHSANEVSKFFADHQLNPKVARAKLRVKGFKAPYTLEQLKEVFKK